MFTFKYFDAKSNHPLTIFFTNINDNQLYIDLVLYLYKRG